MKQVIRFGLTGALTTAVAYLSFILLIRNGVHYSIANVVAWSSSIVIGFVINRRFTFGISGNSYRNRQFAFYVGGAILQLLISAVGYSILIGHLRMNPTLAFIINTLVTATAGFMFMRLVTFRGVAREP